MNVSSAGLRPIANYQEALAHWESVVPFRSGTEKGCKPLGSNRRYKYCQIANDGDAIHLRLLDSNIVSFYEDGAIKVWLGKWDTVTTRQFITATTYFETKYDRGFTYLRIKGMWYVFEDAATPIWVEPDGSVRNPVQEHAYRLDKKKMRATREMFQPFLSYVESMGKVMVGIKHAEIKAVEQRQRSFFSEFNLFTGDARLRKLELPTTLYHRGNPKTMGYLQKFLSKVIEAQEREDLEAFYDYYVLLGVSALTYNNHLEAYAVNYYRSCDIEVGEKMLEYFNEILKYIYREKVFKKIEVPIGEKVTSANRKYFSVKLT